MSRTYLNYQVSLCEFLISKCQGSSSMTKYSVSFPNSYCCNLMFCSIWELSSKQMWFTYFVMCCGTLSHSPDIRGAWNRTLLQPGSTNRPLSNPMQKHMKYVITVFFFASIQYFWNSISSCVCEFSTLAHMVRNFCWIGNDVFK